MNAEEWLWLVFGCKVGKCPDWNETRNWRVTPPTKCIYQVSNWYIKYVEKSPENFGRSKSRKHNRQNTFLAINGIYVEKYTVGHLCSKFEEFISIYEARIAKHKFDLFCCKLGQSDLIVTKLKLDMSCHLLNVWQSFKLIPQSMLKKVRKTHTSKHVEKSPENADRRINGRTDIATA